MQGALCVWILAVVASAQAETCPGNLNLRYNGPDAALKEGGKDAFKSFDKDSELAYTSKDGLHSLKRCSPTANSWKLVKPGEDCTNVAGQFKIISTFFWVNSWVCFRKYKK